jgi:hypothetical protein
MAVQRFKRKSKSTQTMIKKIGQNEYKYIWRGRLSCLEVGWLDLHRDQTHGLVGFSPWPDACPVAVPHSRQDLQRVLFATQDPILAQQVHIDMRWGDTSVNST